MSLIKSTSLDKNLSCSIFPLAKQTRLSFTVNVSRASNPFDLVHGDVLGP